MSFFNSAINILQTLVVAIGAGLAVWGVINLLEGYGNDNPGAKSQGIKQLMAGGGVALIGTQLGEAMIAACAGLKAVTTGGKVGEYHGFTLSASYNLFANSFELTIKGKCSYKIEIGKDPLGNIQRIHNALSSIDKKLAESEQKLETVQQQLATAQEEVKKPFSKETELNEKM